VHGYLVIICASIINSIINILIISLILGSDLALHSSNLSCNTK